MVSSGFNKKEVVEGMNKTQLKAIAGKCQICLWVTVLVA